MSADSPIATRKMAASWVDRALGVDGGVAVGKGGCRGRAIAVIDSGCEKGDSRRCVSLDALIEVFVSRLPRTPRIGSLRLCAAVCVLASLVGLLGGCGVPLAPEQFAPAGPPSKPLVPGRSSEYVVKKGDTLYAVGWVFGVDYRELERINAIEDPRKLKIGQVLLIPERGTNLEFAFPALQDEEDRGKRSQPIEQAKAEPAPAPTPAKPAEESAPGKQGAERTEDVTAAAIATTVPASKDEDAKSPPAAAPAPESPAEPTVIAAAPEPTPPPAPSGSKALPASPAPTPAPNAKAAAADSRARTTALPISPTQKRALPAPPSTKVAIARPDPPPPLPTKVDRWIWPTSGKVIGTFKRGGGKGIDIGGEIGRQVVAAAGGEVVYVGNGLVGYGNMIIIKHTEDLLSAYAHNRSMQVAEGEFVERGDPIAEMGSSGTDRVKLHFEIRHRGKPVDPLKRLPRR